MGFFDHLTRNVEPEPLPPRPARPAWVKPEAALAGIVPVELILARTDDVAVALGGVFAYPTGFEFALNVALRRADRTGRAMGHGLHHWNRSPDDESVPDSFLRLGLAFADGQVATNLDRRGFPPSEDAVRPILMPGGGGGGPRRQDLRFWVWPLPPAGAITIVCEWPAYGIPETRTELDAQPILDAAARAIQLWPEDEEEVIGSPSSPGELVGQLYAGQSYSSLSYLSSETVEE